MLVFGPAVKVIPSPDLKLNVSFSSVEPQKCHFRCIFPIDLESKSVFKSGCYIRNFTFRVHSSLCQSNCCACYVNQVSLESSYERVCCINSFFCFVELSSVDCIGRTLGNGISFYTVNFCAARSIQNNLTVCFIVIRYIWFCERWPVPLQHFQSWLQ